MIRAVEEPTVAIEIESPRIAASLAIQLELVRERMVAPDALLKLDSPNAGSHGASLASVQPAVGPPRQRVGNRVSVVHTETGQQHFGIGIRDIVAVAVGIEEQVGRLQHEDTAVSKRETAREIQPRDKIAAPVGHTVAVGVFQNRNAVGPSRPLRRRLGQSVVLRS